MLLRLLLLLPLFVFGVFAQASACNAVGELEWVELMTVVDGDTLHLTDGRKLRVLAINTPELANRGKPAQPLAIAAQNAVKTFFADQSKVGLQIGQQKKDHYGRWLAHVFRADGKSLAEYLLAQGLAWQVVVPPNEGYWQCLTAHEASAQRQGIGIWQAGIYPALDARQLTTANSGFQRVHGTIRAINRSRDSWWLQLDTLAIRLRSKDLSRFNLNDPNDWLNKTVTIRGWVVDRSASAAVKKKKYSPLMINLQHPAMLK
ncbi:thermonuclease family protein [Oceanicoccus sp. KOV_DT_Chl]|uniref:thermonuclease family protein n=1 Tax=Oceanicoccus sp. KOV_DT_Chl TaxID=1904639 RepID=UPI000C7E6AD0|nr:thermonuclease family protein [Oceanicoccus sp. KOV_DT_Chl]